MNSGWHQILGQIFCNQTTTASILSLPELPNRFRGIIQPCTIRQQRNQFNGTEKLNRIRIDGRIRPFPKRVEIFQHLMAACAWWLRSSQLGNTVQRNVKTAQEVDGCRSCAVGTRSAAQLIK